MSLVADVIATVGHHRRPVSKEEPIFLEMEKLILQSEEARNNVCKVLSSRYIELSTALHNTLKLKQKLNTCLQDVNDLDLKIKEEVIPNVKSSLGEVSQIAGKWREVKCEIEAAQTLLNIHNLLEESHQAQLDLEFHITAHCLKEVVEILADIPKEGVENQLDVMNAIKTELVIRRNDLIYNVDSLWNKSLTWTTTTDHDTISNTLSIQGFGCNASESHLKRAEQMVLVMYELGELSRKLKKFGNNLMAMIIKPIICDKAEFKQTLQSGTLSISVDKNNKSDIDASTIITRVKQVFEFVQNVLFQISLDYEGETVTLTRLLGKEIGENFTKLLLKECLAESVPSSRKDLDKFSTVQTTAEDMHNYLIEIGFYSPDEKCLLEYAANIDTVFSNKACVSLLERARVLMLKPLHVTATITPTEAGDPLMAVDERGNSLEKTVHHLRKILLVQTFNLPKFQVSISVCELVDLLYETLTEACNSSPEYAGRLFYTVRNILSLYIRVVPTAHANTLNTIPQHAALVHNNSLFLSHHANLFGHHYAKRFPTPLRDRSLTTADLGYMIKTSGCEIFLKSMQHHRDSLLNTLKEGADSPLLGTDVQTVGILEHSVLQCLHQLNQLHSVWEDVLPNGVYTKAIGTLLSSVVEEIVLKIVSLQDISADAALGLINVLALIQDNGPKLFMVADDSSTSSGDIIKEVRMWAKMCELIIVLGASLRDLVDRWSDGKGPLALYFTAKEAKQMIRALFQNTERRAQVLARIK